MDVFECQAENLGIYILGNKKNLKDLGLIRHH